VSVDYVLCLVRHGRGRGGALEKANLNGMTRKNGCVANWQVEKAAACLHQMILHARLDEASSSSAPSRVGCQQVGRDGGHGKRRRTPARHRAAKKTIDGASNLVSLWRRESERRYGHLLVASLGDVQGKRGSLTARLASHSYCVL